METYYNDITYHEILITEAIIKWKMEKMLLSLLANGELFNKGDPEGSNSIIDSSDSTTQLEL